jgi:hypothetical protein
MAYSMASTRVQRFNLKDSAINRIIDNIKRMFENSNKFSNTIIH